MFTTFMVIQDIVSKDLMAVSDVCFSVGLLFLK